MPSLDTLRGLAILMVVIFHAYGSFPFETLAGPTIGKLLDACIGECNYGVQLFFLLSGFLIGGILLRARSRPHYYKNFYIKRVLRIVPVYLVVLAVLKVWVPVSWGFTAAALLFMANFSRIFGAPLGEYGSLWSLAVEEHFYLLWPTFVRRIEPRRLIGILVAVLVAEPVLRVLVISRWPNADIRFKTPFVLDYLAYGALLATLVYLGRLDRNNGAKTALRIALIAVPATALTLWLAAFHPSNTLVALRTVPWMWLCCAALLFGLDRDARRPAVLTALHRPRGVFPFFGYISYGLYLINQLLNMKLGPVVAGYMRPEARSSLGALTVTAVFCLIVEVGVAYLSRRYFEQPILEIKDRLTARHGAAAHAVASSPTSSHTATVVVAE